MVLELPFALGELAGTCSPALPEGAARHSPTCPEPEQREALRCQLGGFRRLAAALLVPVSSYLA